LALAVPVVTVVVAVVMAAAPVAVVLNQALL
jgi:hypothetical protein